MIHDWLREQQRGERTTSLLRLLWPLAEFEARALFRSRWGIAMFCLCLLPGLARLVMLLILFGVVDFGPDQMRARLRHRPELPMFDPWRPDFYLEPVVAVMPGMVFALLLTSLVVARTIARDRQANAFELYWTRGITPFGYVLAKWCGGFLVTAAITVAVPLLLWITAVFLAEDWSLLFDSWWPMARTTFALAFATALLTGQCLALSVLCSSPNAAMVAWAMLLVGSTAVGNVMANALDEAWLRPCLSLWDATAVVVRAIAGVPQRGVPVGPAVATLATVSVVLALLARPRLRIVEAVR